MPGLVPGIHVFRVGVDGRDKPGHDDNRAADGEPEDPGNSRFEPNPLA